jgi:CheY-like chemotaxis protein/serine phosphatase RsbU (regulator of sigma subunit)
VTGSPAPTGVTVLVCDDTAAKRYVISSWLRRAGHTVLEAETGLEALQVAADRDVDLAVLDVHLPDMSGLEVCAALKSDPRTAATPVVHVSAVAVEPADRSRGLDRGADAYLTDPIEPQELLSTVRSLLRSAGARRSAEELADRLDRLSALNLRVNVALAPARMAAEAADGVARILGCEALVVLVDEGEGATARGRSDGTGWSAPVPEQDAAALVDALGGTSHLHTADAPWAALLPDVPGDTWLACPVDGPSGTVGLVAVPERDGSAEDDRTLVGRLAQSVSVALANLRVYNEEHRTALTLQRSLLPASLPRLPRLSVAARYRASGEQLEVGGDFFDAFRTDDGRSVVAIGDVQGHSLDAAIVMAELRYSLRAYLHDGRTAEETLVRLNRVLLRDHLDLTATVCLLVFPATAQDAAGPVPVVLANAGHVPPLLVHDGTATYLEPHGTLLGVGRRVDEVVPLALEPGTRLVLMTDGLVERRTESLVSVMDRLALDVAATTARGTSTEELCDHLMERWGDGDDDICLVVVDVATEG